jgi:uncharacterized protein (DUF849 family)
MLAKPVPDRNVIITCAVNGGTLSPSFSPYIPLTVEDTVNQAIAASKAGAAVIHLHARRPEDGRPTADLGIWKEILSGVKAGCDSVINMTTGGAPGMTPEERLGPVLAMSPEMATINVGSMNYGLFKKSEGITEWKYEWEKEFFGPRAHGLVADNKFNDVDRMIDLVNERDIAIEFECFDVGHIYIVAHHFKKKNFKRKFLLQFITGILGGIPSDFEHLLHMKRSADDAFGPDYELCIQGTQMANIRSGVLAGLVGANIRIGLEDNVADKPGKLFTSNEEQVSKIVRIMNELNIGIAGPEEARKRLGAKGKNKQNF